MVQHRPDRARVLLVDDDERDYSLTRRLLAETGNAYDLAWAQTFDEALGLLQDRPFDACLVDLRLGERDGLEFLREAGRRGLSPPMILLTAHGDSSLDAEAQRLGASGFLEKGKIDAVTLDRSLRYALAREHLVTELLDQNTELLRLHRLTEIMLAPGPVDAVLQRTAEEVARGTGFPIVTLERYRPRRRVLETVVQLGLPLPPAREPRPVDRALAGPVVLSGKARLGLELEEPGARNAEDLALLWMRTYLCLPVQGNGEVLGALTLAHPDAIPVDSDQLEQAQALARHIGRVLPALERRAEEETQVHAHPDGGDLREDLTALVHWYAREARRRGLRLEQEVLVGDGGWPRGDATQARRVLGLLLSGALRFGGPGDLRVQLLPESAEEHVLVRFPAPGTEALVQACREACGQLGASFEQVQDDHGTPTILLGARFDGGA